METARLRRLVNELVGAGILERAGDGYRLRADFLEQLLYAMRGYVENFVSDPAELRRALVDEEELRTLLAEICTALIAVRRFGGRPFRRSHLVDLAAVFMDVLAATGIEEELLKLLRTYVEDKLRRLGAS